MESFVEELFSGKARNELTGAIRGRGGVSGGSKVGSDISVSNSTTDWNMKTRRIEVLEQICYDLHFEMRCHLLYIIKRMS